MHSGWKEVGNMPEKKELDLLAALHFYNDAGDEMEDVLVSFETMQEEIETALDDLHDELELIKDHLDDCYRRYQGCLRKRGISIDEEWEVNSNLRNKCVKNRESKPGA